jgi:hypothetical protein
MNEKSTATATFGPQSGTRRRTSQKPKSDFFHFGEIPFRDFFSIPLRMENADGKVLFRSKMNTVAGSCFRRTQPGDLTSLEEQPREPIPSVSDSFQSISFEAYGSHGSFRKPVAYDYSPVVSFAAFFHAF